METYSVTVSRLGIKDPDLVSVSPERSNVYLTVHPRSSLKELLKKYKKEFVLGNAPI